MSRAASTRSGKRRRRAKRGAAGPAKHQSKPAPKSAPITAPITVPITAPIAAPTAPITAPITEPITAPITEPITAPIAAPRPEPIPPPRESAAVRPIANRIPRARATLRRVQRVAGPVVLACLVGVFARASEVGARVIGPIVPEPAVASATTAPIEAAPPAITAFTPTHAVTGSIVDGAGQPIANVRVAVRDSAAAGTTDDAGAFRIAAPIAARHTLVLDAPHVFPAEVAWRTGEPAPRILLARRAQLQTRVTADGVAIAGAEVSLTDGSRPTLATATTDRDGVARFADLVPGPHELFARHGTQVSALVRVGETAGEVALALAPGATLGGRVVADTALPAGATATLVPIDVDHAVRVAPLDRDGGFAIAGAPHGRWRVVGAAAGFIQDGEQVLDTRGGEAVVRMLRAGGVTGTVVDGSGAPVANATIVLRGQDVRAAMPIGRPALAAGGLRWVHPLAGRRVLPGRDALRFGAPRPGVRPAECGDGHCGVDIGWQRGTIIHAAADGVVVHAFPGGRGEAGRYLAIEHGDGLRTYYMHLDELRAGLEVGHRVRAGDAIGAMGATGFANGPHLHFSITQQRDGRAWHIDPEPVLQHAVVLVAPRPLDPFVPTPATVVAAAPAELTGPVAPASITTDARGRFVAGNLAPGSYVAVAFAADLAPGTSTPFAVRSNAETGGIAITLRPGVLVEGRVIGRDGPLPGATITATAGGGESAQDIATAYARDRGEFTMRALTGTITLTASAPGHGSVERTLTLGTTAGRRVREDFVLVTTNAQLRGQVLAGDGGPAGTVQIRIVEGPVRRTATTDATGRFTIDHVADGSYVVEASSPDHPATRATLRTDRWTDVRLDRGGSVQCELRDAYSSAPLAAARVEATGPSGQTASASADARGTALLRGLALGEWTVRVRAKGYAETRRTVTIRPTTVPHELRFDVARGATISGVVRDRYGRRVAGARVWTDGTSTQTDGDGQFRLVDAPPGPRVVEAELDGVRGQLQLHLAPGDDRGNQTIELAQ